MLISVVVQSLSRIWLFVTAWTAAHQASLSFTISWSLLKLMSIDSVMLPSHLILCYLPLLPSVFPNIRVFSNELALRITWTRIGASTSASVLPMNIQGWYPSGLTGLIFLLPKGLSRVFSSTTVQKHQFFGAQPLWSNSHICTWLLDKLKFWLYGRLLAGIVMSLLFNTLSRFVIDILSRSKGLSISWLQYHTQWFWSPRK